MQGLSDVQACAPRQVFAQQPLVQVQLPDDKCTGEIVSKCRQAQCTSQACSIFGFHPLCLPPASPCWEAASIFRPETSSKFSATRTCFQIGWHAESRLLTNGACAFHCQRLQRLLTDSHWKCRRTMLLMVATYLGSCMPSQMGH